MDSSEQNLTDTDTDAHCMANKYDYGRMMSDSVSAIN